MFINFIRQQLLIMKNIITFFLLFSFVFSINGQEVDSFEELKSRK